MRLLITGAGGLLGLNLALDAMRWHEVTGLSRGRLTGAPFPFLQVDLLETGAMVRALEESRAEAVVHCAAAADLDFCERNPHLAHRINVEVPEQIASECTKRDIRMIHISTDAVFDGRKRGEYTEADEPCPVGVYAVTKRAAEDAVIRASRQAIVARVNFYGWSASGQRSLAEFFVNNLRKGSGVHGFVDVWFCPMLVNDLADLLLALVVSDLHGVYHVVGPQAMTKYQFGVEIARRFGFNEALIAPQAVEDSGLVARRSHNLRLSTHKLSTELGWPLPGFSTGIERFYSQYTQGYPQKVRSYRAEQPG